MNLLEYVQSLGSDISLEEKIALTKDWKEKNEPVETIVEEVKPNKFNEDGSLNVDSFSEETKGSAEKVNEKKKTAAVQDNATAFPVMSESISFGNGQSKSLFQESDWLKSYKKQQKQKEAFETQQTKLNSIVSENEMYTANGYDLKWGVSKKGNIEYYQKEEGAKDWKLEKNDGAIFDIAGALGHLNEEQKKKLKEFKKQQKEQKKQAGYFNDILNRSEDTFKIDPDLGKLDIKLGQVTVKPKITGTVNQELIEAMDNDNLNNKSIDLTYYTDKKNAIKEIKLQRSEIENKAKRIAKSKGLDEEQSLDFINKELANFDDQYGSEIELLEDLNGLTELQRKALVELKKDTGNNASTGNTSQQLGNYFNSALSIIGVDLEEVFRDPEVIELNNEVELNIINSLSQRDLEKLAKGYFNLKEKEELINKAKIPIYQRKSKFLSRAFENLEETYKGSLTAMDTELADLKLEMNNLYSTGLNTQSQLNAYSDLSKKYSDISLLKNDQITAYTKELGDLVATKNFVEGDLNMSFSKNTINNNFKLTDEVIKYRESFAGEGFWNGTMDVVGGEGIGGMYELVMKANPLSFGATLVANGLDWIGDMVGSHDPEGYSVYEAWADTIYNFTDYGLVPKSEDEKFSITKEEGGFSDFNLRNYGKTGVRMLPFSLYLIGEARKGKVSNIQQSIGKALNGFNSTTKVLTPLSAKLKNNIIMAEAAFRGTYADNVKDAQSKGLFGAKGYTYAASISLAEGLVQSIMPDTQFLKGVGGRKLKDAFAGRLSKAATIEATKTAGKEFSINILKEYGEEQVNYGLGLITDISYGLALPKSSEFLNEQIELAAGTLMLSSGMGSIGAVKTFNNQKTLIYNQLAGNLDSTMLYLDTLKKNTSDPSAIEQITKAQQFAFNVAKAVRLSPSDVTGAEVDLLMEKTELLKEKDNTDSAFHKPINDKIAELDKQIVEINKTKIEESKSRAGAKNIKDQIGTTLETFSDQATIDARVEEIKQQGGNVLESTGYGQALVLDGKKIILINDQAQAEDFRYTTDQHELLHHFFLETFKTNPDAAIKFGKALISEIVNNPDITGGFEFMERFNDYLTDENYSAANTFEEVIPLISESLTNGDIVYNKKQDSFWKAIGKQISSLFKNPSNKQKLGITFDTGLDVFTFIKDFNKTIESGGKLTEEQVRISKEGATGELVTGDLKIDGRTKGSKVVKVINEAMVDATADAEIMVAKESKKNTGTEASAKVQEIFEAKGTDGAFDIIQQFKPIVNKLVERRSQAPNFDRQLLTDEIETGRRGIIDLIKEYDPKSNVPLAAYVNKFLPARAIEASQRVLGEEFTTDVTEAKGIAAEEVTTEVSTKPVTRKIKPSSLISKDAVTKIKEQIQEKIKGIDSKNLTFKKLGDLAPEIIAKEIGIPVKKLTVPAANLSKADATAIQQFVNKNADKLLKILPQGAVVEAATEKLLGTSTGVPKGLLEAFYTKKARLGKGAGLSPFVLNKGITKAKFLEAFGIVDGKKQEGFKARSSQAQALKGIANLYGRLVTNEIVRSDTDLSLETKQDVAAGKNTSMASKRINTEAEIPAALMDTFKDLSILRSKKQLANKLGFSSPPINESNRKEQQDKVLEAVIKYGLDTATLEAGMMGSGGRQSFYGNIVKGKFVKKAEKDGGKKYVKTTDGEYILEKSKRGKLKGSKITNWVAKPGRLYYGNQDPAFQTLIKEAKKYEGKKAKRVGVKNAFTEKSIEQSKVNMATLDHVVNQLADAVAKGMSLDVAGAIVIQSYQATSGLIKIAAPFKYKSILMEYAGSESKQSQREGEKFREEHNPPASVIGAQIMFAIKYNAAKPIMKAIKENYYQTQLSKKDDNKLDMAKLDATLVEGQTIFDNPISRLAAAGINLQTLVNPITGKTIAEESGFGIDPTMYNKYNTNEKLQASSIQNEAILEGLKNPEYNVAKIIKASLPLVAGKSMASKRDGGLIPDAIKYDRPITVQTAINALEKTDKALNNARRLDAPVKKIRVFDFDDTLAKSKSMVIVNMPDGSSKKINATQFAQQASDLESQGAEFDFTEFSKVVEGKKGPLFEVAQKIADARGTEDVFILTARPQNADGPIKAFMKANGIDIPLKNITGLSDGTAEAKAGWIMGKAAEGYNDFYFADDAIKNVKAVKNVLSQIDVKSEVQLAKASKRTTFDAIVNDMIEDSAGIETYKKYSAARAKTVGANKGKFNFFIPASAEDFTGLLYKMLGKGKKGDAQMAFLKTNLLDPYDRAESAVTQAKIAAANDFKALKQNLKTLPKSLSKPTGVGGFTFSHAVRVAVWSKQGMSIPGLSKKDIKELNDFVDNNAELSVFTDELMKIQKGKPYPKPGNNWLGGNITSDIINGINKVNRAEYQQEWRENVDIIFSEDNMNKMEAAYGTRWREAMEDSLRRMKSGSNRPPGGNRVTDGLLDWLNNSVGAVMFLNTRSALLQTISSVNFINWGDNNIVKAGLAFANQKQFWSDFMTLMNSDYLVERRNGLKINVSESEIADAVRDSKNKVKSAIAFLLSKGFVMTRFADSFAIATGGSTFYRNRVKALVAKGMDQKAAEKQAFNDFRQIAEESQQSSNPNRISAQQASGAGRVILAWANTPMQYARIQKRAAQDLINGRGDWKTNVSKIVYYGAVQNLIFNALQQAVFALGFGEDDEEEMDAKKSEKISRIANGMIDSQLKGLGIGGAAVVALKTALMELGKQHAKDRSKYEEAVFDLLGFSPPLGSKIQKINSGLRSFSWNMKDIKSKGFSLDNPAYLAGAQITTGLTNIPLDRVIKKLNSMRGIVNEQSALWQKVALGLGWSTWDVGLGYYGGFDAAKVLTPEEQAIEDVTTMKKETKTKEQVDMLLDLGLTKKEIKALGKEQARVEKIIELQKAEVTPKVEPEVKSEEVKEESKQETKPKNESAERKLRRQFDSIKGENKPDQVKTLLKFGLSKKEIRALQYEKNRVNKILELMKKNK